jgi:hypothetical protein
MFIRKIMTLPTTVFLLISCVILLNPSEPAASDISFTVGPLETVMTRQQLNSANLSYWPDGTMGVIKSGSNYNFWAANTNYIGKASGTLNNPAAFGGSYSSVQNPKANYNYYGGGPVYRDPATGTLLMFVHTERWANGSPSAYWGTIAMAKSIDGGNSWTDLGEIITPKVPFSEIGRSYSNMDVGSGPYLIIGSYIYVYFHEDSAQGSIVNLAVARASLSDVVNAAINQNTVVPWFKYYNGSFSEPGFGGMASQLEAANQLSVFPSVSYNQYLGRYLMSVLNAGAGIYDLDLLDSQDGITWSDRQRIESDAGMSAYPSIVGTGTDPSVTDQQFYVYYLYSLNEGTGNGNRWTDGVLARRLISLTSSSPPPDTTIMAGPPSLSNSTSATFSFTSSDPSSTFSCSLDNGSFSSCASPKAYSGLAEGGHNFQVRATDTANNTDPTPASYSWTIDITPPDTSITSAATNGTSASFSFTSTESGSISCSLDGSAFAGCASPKTYSGLAEGSHNFQVKATDSANNTDPSPATYTWTIDTTPPDTTITSNPPEVSTSTTASFSFVSSETGSTFACSLDGNAFSSCASPQTYSNLSTGSHTFRVRAIDAAGNFDTTPASYTWTIAISDTIPPDTIITTSPTPVTKQSTAMFKFISTEPGSTFACKLDKPDESPFTPCTSPQNYNQLGNGSHKFEVYAIDPSGNKDPSPATFTWTIQ